MKAILKYSLYKRPQPTNEMDAAGYLEMNSAIEVNQVLSGKSIDGIGIWFYTNDGFYYWGGGADFSDIDIFQPWDGLSVDIKKALLESVVSDKLYWLEKKVVGYVGCGWGYKNDDIADGLSVSVFVDQKTSTTILNKTIRYKGFDIPIDVKETNVFSHHQYRPNLNPIASDTYNPIEMGGSICRQDQKFYGTRSMILENGQGIRCLMSCFHVLLDQYLNITVFTGSQYQPVLTESPAACRNPFRMNVRKGLRVIEGRYNAYYDFALIELPDDIIYKNAFNDFYFNNYYLLEDLKSLVGKTVSMGGAKSSQQSGVVKDIQASITIKGGHVYRNVILVEKISEGGDSGAPVVDDTGKLVGIVVAGDERIRTLVLPITYLFTLLNYKFYKK